MSNWQPIETAPKDERLILVWGGRPSVGEAAFMPNQPFIVFWMSNSTENGGAWVYSRQLEDILRIYLNPTHWMPLPEPPK